nr:hypothetical protein [Candidatus Sigynarchaeota archaeon]
MAELTEKKTLNVQCPVCGGKQDVDVPAKVIKENVKGVSTIAVNAACGHSYHIFVDKNFSIRGYQRSDFDVSVTAVDNTAIDNLSLPGIVRMFGEDAFASTVHALLTDRKAVLMGSDPQILKSLFINFISLFEQELADSSDTIEIMSKDEYKNLNPLHYSNDLIIDLDFSVIKSNPFKDDKVKTEKNLLKSCLGISNIEQQKIEFKASVSRVFLYANVMLNFIYQGNNNYKDIKKIMKQKEKDISQTELDLAWMVANARYAKLLK